MYTREYLAQERAAFESIAEFAAIPTPRARARMRSIARSAQTIGAARR